MKNWQDVVVYFVAWTCAYVVGYMSGRRDGEKRVITFAVQWTKDHIGLFRASGDHIHKN